MPRVLLILWMFVVTWSMSGCQSSEKSGKTETSNQEVLSAAAKLFLNTLSKNEGLVTDEMKKKYAFTDRDGKTYVRGTAKVSNPDSAENTISKTGTLIESKSGNIWTLLIPVDSFGELTQVSDLSYLDIDTQSEITR